MGFLTGKTAIITGAGRAVLKDGSCGSIGYGIATAYAKEGANLVITGRNLKKLENAKQELKSRYGIRGLSRVAATEWGRDGINVNVVCPLAWTAKLEQFQQAYPDAFKANVKMPPHGPLRQRRDRDRPGVCPAGRAGLQVHVRRDPDAGRRHGPAAVIPLFFDVLP